MAKFQVGDTVTIGDKEGTIIFISEQARLYQVMFSKRLSELIPFDQVEKSEC